MAALVTLAAAGNSLLRGVQSLRYGRQVRRVDVPDDPIFIIGHWRTGTTMLHELLALDARHRCPSTYESLVAESLSAERALRPSLRPVHRCRAPARSTTCG